MLLLKNPISKIEGKPRTNASPNISNAIFYGQKIGKSV
jgi:hypothetical protein